MYIRRRSGFSRRKRVRRRVLQSCTRAVRTLKRFGKGLCDNNVDTQTVLEREKKGRCILIASENKPRSRGTAVRGFIIRVFAEFSTVRGFRGREKGPTELRIYLFL